MSLTLSTRLPRSCCCMRILPQRVWLADPGAVEPNPLLAAQVRRVEACPEGRRGEERSEGEAGDGRDQDPVGGGGGGGPGVLAREEGADGGRERPPLVRAEPVPAAADAGGRDQGRGRGLGVALGRGASGARRRRRRRGVPQLGHGSAARRMCGGCRFPSSPLLLLPRRWCLVSRRRSGGGDGSELLGYPE